MSLLGIQLAAGWKTHCDFCNRMGTEIAAVGQTLPTGSPAYPIRICRDCVLAASNGETLTLSGKPVSVSVWDPEPFAIDNQEGE